MKKLYFPFNILNTRYAENVMLNTKALNLISNATFIPLSTDEDYECVDDSANFHRDFDTLETYPFHLLEVSSVNKQVFIVTSVNSGRNYLLTWVNGNSGKNCIEIKNAVLLNFTCGNMHWHYGRSAILYSEDRIEISESKWHESDEDPEKEKLIATLSINKDGSVQIKYE